jgi:septum formation protein
LKKIILASTSIYRRQLFEKVGVEFTSEKPSFDEDAVKLKCLQESKSALQVAEVLSRGKAKSIFDLKRDSALLVISGDQLVSYQNQIIGKAHSIENAFAQLKKLNHDTHQLITATTLMTMDKTWHLNHLTTLKMKKLSDEEIMGYLKKDEPFDCAGSYKIEKNGICLFEKIECDDFTAIQGLPLIWITNTLKELGYELFKK